MDVGIEMVLGGHEEQPSSLPSPVLDVWWTTLYGLIGLETEKGESYDEIIPSGR